MNLKRTPLKRTTPMKSGRTGLPRSKPKSRKKLPPGGFPENVRMAARHRSGGRCEARRRGCTGRASELHHRKLRRHKDNSLENALYVCNACHVEIHHEVQISYFMGHLVHGFANPAQVPVFLGDG